MRLSAIALAACVCLGLTPAARAGGAGDVAAFRAAQTAVVAGDWVAAEAAVAGAGAVARDLVRWQRLRDGLRPTGAAEAGAAEAGAGDPRDPDPSFADYAAFVAARPDWPGQERLRREGERAIGADAVPEAVIAWFAAAPPQTGEGAAALARAHLRLGQDEEARAVVRTAWLSLGLTPEGEAALRSGWEAVLDPLDRARAEAMLWRWRTADAERIVPRLAAGDRALVLARIAVIREAPDAADRIAAVPAALADDPGLACDRFNRLAERGDYSAAIAILQARTGDAARLGQPLRWAAWRALLARWLIREGRGQEARDLAATHHLDPQDEEAAARRADLEWIAGYAALTGMGDPAGARAHFALAEAAAQGPIARARAAFWAGRAEEAAGNREGAEAAWARAAAHQTAFYGLLAAERLGLPLDPALTGDEAFADWRTGSVLRDDRTAAMLLLATAGAATRPDSVSEAALFATGLGQSLTHEGVGQLGALLIEAGEPFLAITLGKAAEARGISVPALLYPVHPLVRMDLPVAPDLALAIARQESRFNAQAGSGAGALGLMQLMPGTAEEVARGLGLPWERARLTQEWDYNATLGAAYLARLQARFGDSPAMVAAGYNAGPGRPAAWIETAGDPRRGGADPVDWIEAIPFAETRDYVMRVTEAMPVYRARLGIGDGRIGLMAIITGEVPRIRPQARPDRSTATLAEAVAAAVGGAVAGSVAAPAPGGAPSSLAPQVAPRPMARP